MIRSDRSSKEGTKIIILCYEDRFHRIRSRNNVGGASRPGACTRSTRRFGPLTGSMTVSQSCKNSWTGLLAVELVTLHKIIATQTQDSVFPCVDLPPPPKATLSLEIQT